MKNFRRILILILCLLPLAMQAQDQQGQQDKDYTVHTVKWYEDLNSIARNYNVDPQDIIDLNGLKSSILKSRQQLKIPLKKAKDKLSEAGQAVRDAAQQTAEALDSATTSWGEYLGQIISKIFNKETDTVNATLILPFNTSSGINGSNYDFYSGVLLAVKDFSDQGINTNLQVFDFQGSSNPASYSELSKSDIILGPLSTSNITAVLDDCAWNQYVISPLDSRAAALAEEGRHVIQAPSSADSQFDEIITWIKEDFKSGDKVILFTENNSAQTALASKLAQSGLQYSTVNYGILQGRNIEYSLQNQMTKTGANHVVIASDKEAFVNDVVRNLNLMSFRDFNVILYGPSRIRNFETIDVENFHNTHLHLCSSYFVDYDDPAVKSFLMTYRALFNAEPTAYSFQGYDTAKYFIGLFVNYGSDWIRHLDDNRYRGLQTDFKFSRNFQGGYLNKAVRRIVYNPDWTVTLLK
ncbi:MAG: LysM peptidoglycan-binding domain-containing protein [Bacteroidales bacterium]|nr:LysM peptidoglycan-binding domain-containing protein [Bacteroidales bacterium]